MADWFWVPILVVWFFFDFDTKTWLFLRNDPDNPNSLGSNNIEELALDDQGTLWIGCNDYGLIAYDTVYQTLEHFPIEGVVLSDIELDGDSIWISTSNMGLMRFDKKTKTYEKIKGTETLGQIYTMFIDSKGNHWVGSRKGAILLKEILKGNFASFFPMLENRRVLSIHEDNTGVLWIGTYNNGLFKSLKSKGMFDHWDITNMGKNRLSNNLVRTVAEDLNGDIWVGLDGNGIDVFAKKSSKTLHYNINGPKETKIPNNRIRSILAGNDGSMWIGSYGGLTKINRNQKIEKTWSTDDGLPHQRVYSLFEDRDGGIWIGTLSGLAYLKNDKITKVIPRKNPDIFDIGVQKMVQDSGGFLWLATFGNGLVRLNMKDFDIVQYIYDAKNPKSISHNIVIALLLEDDDILWVGTRYGLNRTNVKDISLKFDHFTDLDGLANNVVKGILIDKNKGLWVSTNEGVSHINPLDKSIRNFGQAQGLINIEFNRGAYCKSKDGQFYFGGDTGLTSFVPEKVEISNISSPIWLSQIWVNETRRHQKINGSKMQLKHFENNIRISLSIMDYIATERNQFAYKIQPLHDEWQFLGSTHTISSNLPPGDYTILFKGRNSFGSWSPENIMSLEVAPAPWKSPFAYLVYALGCIQFFIVIIFWQRNLERRKNQMLLLEKEKQLAKDTAESKSRFVAHFSHELRNPLSALLGYTEMIKKRVEDSDEDLMSKVKKLSHSAHFIKVLVDNVLHDAKMLSGHMTIDFSPVNISQLIDEVTATAEPIILHNNNRLLIHVNCETEEIFTDGIKIRQVLVNLLINAGKYCKDGEVVLDVYQVGTHLVCMISDKGIGLSKEKQDLIFQEYTQVSRKNIEGTGLGLYLCKQFVDLLGGDIKVTSIPDSGTVFTVRFPMK